MSRTRTQYLVFMLAAALLFPCLASGQDIPPRGDVGPFTSFLQSSPFRPQPSSDTIFSVDAGPFLDTPCLFSSSGPLIIDFEIDRVVGSPGASIEELVANEIIAPEAILRMPVFDVDSTANVSGINPERDLVRLNGHPLSPLFLKGINEEWILNEFSVPVSFLNFPSDPGPENAVVPATNTIRIDIDTANDSEQWCTAVDWVEVEIQAVRPVAFFHGILSDKTIWDTIWIPELRSRGILTDSENLGKLASIESNSQIVRRVIDRMRARWGVDKVKVVAHSKGGLDARHFIEDTITVEEIIQIATPNAGSPLADYVQGGLLIGSIASPHFLAAASTLNAASPAGRQLTTFYMAFYNLFHPVNPRVDYTAVAGDYSGAPLFSVRSLLGFIIPGPDDTIVPVSSVHALPITNEPTFPSTGSNLDATHGGLHQAFSVFNRFSGSVRQFGARGVTTPTISPSLLLSQHTGTIADTIAPSETSSYDIMVDGDEQIFLTLHYALGDLDLAVTTEDGTRIDADSAPGLAGFHHEGLEDIDGFKFEIVTIEAPNVGNLTLEVTATDIVNPEGQEAFLLTGWCPDTDLTLTANSPNLTISRNDDLTLEARLSENGQGLAGASVKAMLLLPDDTTTEIALLDSGVGDYTTSLDAPLMPGVYRIVIQANGDTSTGSTFSREAFLFATVGASSSEILGPHSDFGMDSDGDGLFDSLALEVGIDSSLAASYRLVGQLTDVTGSHVIANAHAEMSLPAGLETLTLLFSGREIFSSKMNGPYLLKVARLAEKDEATNLLPVDEVVDVHTTGAYAFSDFEHEPVLLSGVSSLVGIDDDNNGLFDRLEARIEIDILEPGSYEWSGRLRDPAGNDIQLASNTGALVFGANEISLEFDGCRVRASGEDGNFTVDGLLVFGGLNSLVTNESVASTTLESGAFECDAAEVANLVLAGSASPNPVAIGEDSVYTLTIINNGEAEATNVLLQSMVSENALIRQTTASQGICNEFENFITCNLETLAVGSAATVDILITPQSEGLVLNTANVEADQPDLESDDNGITLEVSAGSITVIPTLDSMGFGLLILLLTLGGIFHLRRGS